MKHFLDAEILFTAFKGAVGLGATTGGFYVSILPKVEAWLRVCSLFIGCAVGIATFVSILRKHKQKRQSRVPSGSATSPKNDPKK